MKITNYDAPEVSVISAVFNRANYLSRCINSLLNQSFGNWELIAIDDGSEDDSHKILKDFELKDERIKVIKQPNMKLPLSRNKGISVSTGKYITFLDSDDEYRKDHLIKRIKFMNENPAVDLIHGGVEIIGDEFVRDKNDPHKFIHLSECTIGATFFGKRNVFVELNGFKNLNYSEDSEFLERAEKKFNVVKINYKTYIYHREVPDSITNTYRPASIKSQPKQLHYFAANKPFNMLSQFTDKDGRKTLSSMIKAACGSSEFPKDVYPVGRLDFDSEGLLLLTNDKQLADYLLNPKNLHEREYFVQVEGIPSEEDLQKLRCGIKLNDFNALPAKVKKINEPSLPKRNPPVRERKTIPTQWLSITLTEGKNRQVRRMTAAIGFPTLRLIRVRIKNILLANLLPGEIKELGEEEILLLKK